MSEGAPADAPCGDKLQSRVVPCFLGKPLRLGVEAAAEFQRILDNPGIVMNCSLGAGERSPNALLQFCVLGLGLLQDGNARLGVFPECEEILIRRRRLVRGPPTGNRRGPVRGVDCLVRQLTGHLAPST